VKLKEYEKRARFKFWFGLVGSIVFGFTTIIALLKSLYVSFGEIGGFVQGLSELVGKLINLIYNYTDFLTFFWDVIWKKLPIFDPLNLAQENNYYFFALFAATLFSITQVQDSFWIRSKINESKRKIEDELLERDIKKQSGLIDTNKTDILELEINVGSPDSWYKRPLGMIVIGLFVAIVGKIIVSIIGVDG
jgi:hypothetical protein